MHSLSRRLVLSVSAPLLLFFAVTSVVLDANFRDLSRRTLEGLLESQMVALIAAAEPLPDGSFAPLPRVLDSRLATPGSGLYAAIRIAGHGITWRSPSAAGAFIDFGEPLRPGRRSLIYTRLPDDTVVAINSRGIAFEDEDTRASRELTFTVATSTRSYEDQLWRFRRQLFGWFVALTLLLFATLGALLRWVLTPVRGLEREITAVEEGRNDSLGGVYPRELAGVAKHLNALLVRERQRVARYRDTLGNLAHSLKTPLAVMRSTLDASRTSCASTATLDAQIDRMTEIIEHQLKRAAASGGATLGQAPIDIAPIVSEIRAALLKVYAAKDLSIELAIPREAQFFGDRGDFTELLGNLLDNACKWCRGRVRLTLVSQDTGEEAAHMIAIAVDDDGPGISTTDRKRVLERGTRADESMPGHGLGLAMVRDTVELYGGALGIDASALGGASVRVTLPGRGAGTGNR